MDLQDERERQRVVDGALDECWDDVFRSSGKRDVVVVV